MQYLQKIIIYIFGLIILSLCLWFFNWQFRDKVLQIQYDLKNDTSEIYSKGKIKNILGSFEKINFSKLDKSYLSYTKSDQSKYKKLLQNLTFYKIKRTDLNKVIVGDFRLKEFICKDAFYKECVLNRRSEITVPFNEKIFYKTLHLLEELDRLGFNKYGFTLVNGHRHPKYNEQVGGASLSRHIRGEAVDITIDDINNDGWADKTDKDIVLDLLERIIIKDEGGIGLYPGTDNVHYDVRGHRARWNSY